MDFLQQHYGSFIEDLAGTLPKKNEASRGLLDAQVVIVGRNYARWSARVLIDSALELTLVYRPLLRQQITYSGTR